MTAASETPIVDGASGKHGHEPEIPPVLAEDGSCRICKLLLERSDLKRRLVTALFDRDMYKRHMESETARADTTRKLELDRSRLIHALDQMCKEFGNPVYEALLRELGRP